ncbi:MAG: phosphoglucosamine mutase [Nitrospirota bacterium]
MRELFGTDGVRGTANVHPMTGEMAMKLGRAAAHIFKNKSSRRHRIIIGKDTRLSGYMIESAITSGICSFGVDVLIVGPMPTPAVAFLTRSLRADAGVMISASHNSFEDNGIKFFSSNGQKLPDQMEMEIERLIISGEIDNIRPTAVDIGKAYRIDDAEGRYIEFVKNALPKGRDFSGLKVIVDCGNGAAYKVAPAALTELSADVIVLHNTPNGTNINKNCGALHPSDLQNAVTLHRADLGIALDGDADRATFVDEKGDIVPGEVILSVFAKSLQENKNLVGSTVVTTEHSNTGMDKSLQKSGIQVIRTQVGDRYVLEEMLLGGYNLGGESSGHVIFSDYNTTGDGLLTALQFLSLLKKTGKTVSQLTTEIQMLPQTTLNIHVSEKKTLREIPKLQDLLDQYESKLAGNGRLLIRYSGTEKLLRIMVEGEDRDIISEMAENLAKIVREAIGISTH